MKTAAHQYEDKLLELAYGELSAPEASAVESHVRTCARCTEALTEIRTVRMTMGQLPMVPAPDSGLESLFAYAEQAARRHAAGPAPAATWWRRFMAPLAAAGALSIIGVVAYQTSSEKVVPSRADVAVGAVAEKKSEAALETATATPIAAAKNDDAPLAGAPADQGEQEAAAGYDSLGTAPAPQYKERKNDELTAKADTRAKKMAPAKPAAALGDELQKAGRLSASKKGGEGRYGDGDFRQDNYAERARGFSPSADKSGAKAPIAKDEAPPPPPAPVVAAAPQPAPTKAPETASSSYGVVGVGGGATPRAAPSAEQNRVAEPPQLAQAPSQYPPAPGSRTSMNFGMNGGSSDSQRQVVSPQGSRAEERRSATEDDSLAAANKPADARKQQVANLDAKMKSIREESQQRDTKSELELSMDVLKAGAKGSQRLEALSRVCNGLEALGKVDEAYPYCRMMITEFPNAVATRAWLDRQNRGQRAKRAAPKSSYDLESERPAEKAEPAPASPPADKPAQSY